MAGNNNFQGSISAEENILHAISLLDRSMSKMVELEASENGSSGLDKKFVAIRLQIDNLQAKCDHLLSDRDTFQEGGENAEDDLPAFYEKIDDAKDQLEEDKNDVNVSDIKATRKYFTSTLEAVYGLLARKGIYQAVGEKSVEDGTVDPRDNMEA